MDENEIANQAYILWEQAGQPDGRSEHFWEVARTTLERSAFEMDLRDPSISEFNKRLNSENRGSFSGDLMRVDRLFDAAAEKAFGTTPLEPEGGLLWHYTTGANVASIIEKGEIWLTRLDCLNDSSEYRLSFDILSEVLSLRPTTAPTSNEHSFHEYLIRRFKERPLHFENCFITCFSTERNDLSQWRAYGGLQGENGFAIGFEASKLARNKTALSLKKVQYGGRDLRRFLSRVLERMFDFYLNGSAWDPDRQDLRRAWEDISYTIVERQAIKRFPFFKDQAFKSENEWRLVCWPDVRSDASFEFKQSGLMLKQHLKLSASRIGFRKDLLPIREIVVGPSRHAQASKLTLENLLSLKGYNLEALGWKPKVSTSNIPLQAT